MGFDQSTLSLDSQFSSTCTAILDKGNWRVPTAHGTTGYLITGMRSSQTTQLGGFPITVQDFDHNIPTSTGELSELPVVAGDTTVDPDFQWSSRLTVNLPQDLTRVLNGFVGSTFTGSITFGVNLLDNDEKAWANAEEWQFSVDMSTIFSSLVVSTYRYLGEQQARSY